VVEVEAIVEVKPSEQKIPKFLWVLVSVSFFVKATCATCVRVTCLIVASEFDIFMQVRYSKVA